MDMRIPPRNNKIMLESNPLKSRVLVRRSAATQAILAFRLFMSLSCC